MEWKKAVVEVLSGSTEPMHYSNIAIEIAKRRLRKKNELGATPANTVAVTISKSLQDEEDGSPFVRVTRGYYALRSSDLPNVVDDLLIASVPSPVAGIINALGMFWERSKVIWKTDPKLLGRQQQGSETIDFSKQIGIYFLHDSQGVVYVGKTSDQSLGRRLQQHTIDRLNGRWDRFSWFGLYPVENDGSLRSDLSLSGIPVDVVITTLEAVLIEGLEPRQNRRRGDDFQAVEFLQAEDPSIEQGRNKRILEEMAVMLASKGAS